MNKTFRSHLLRLLTVALVFMLGIIIVSCGDDSSTNSTTTTEAEMVQVTSLPTVLTFEKIWGDVDNGVGPFIVGQRGQVYQRSGADWDSIPFTSIPEKTLTSAWGNSPTNVFFTGLWDDYISYNVIDTSEDDEDEIDTTLYIADAPILTRYNGSRFIDFVVDFEWGLYDVWGSADDDVYAVGYDGTLLHYDGSAWETITTDGDDAVWLNAVWGSSDSDVYASGSVGALIHYDGTDWEIIPTKTGQSLWDVWGTSDTDIFLVGASGAIAQYDGSSFSWTDLDIEKTLYSVWGTGPDNVYAAGWGGEILHYDGTTWTEIEGITDFGFLSVWGTGPTDIYFVGQTVLHYDGLNFTPVRLRNEPDFTDIWYGQESSEGTQQAVMVGTGGRVLQSTGGNVFSYLTVDGSSISTDLYGVGGHVDTATFIVGADGTILERNRSDLADWITRTSPVTSDLYSVSVLSESIAYAVGIGGVILEYDGSGWSQVANGLTSVPLRDVWVGEVGDDTVIVAVGDDGVVIRHDGVAWSAPTPVTSANLTSVFGLSNGDVYAVGGQGTVVKYDSGDDAWSAVPVSGTVENLTSIWAADASNMFVSAEGGRVFSFNGSSFTEIDTGTTFDLNGLFGISSTDIFVAGDFNHVFHYTD